MNFNSLLFVQFAGAAAAIYYFLPLGFRKFYLLLASYGFYLFFSVPYTLLLAGVTVFCYEAGLFLDTSAGQKPKGRLIAVCLLVLVGNLLFYKVSQGISGLHLHFPFGGSAAVTVVFSGLIPLGLSYYTFKVISYLLDVHWGKIKAEKDFIAFACYVSFFPQMLSGPIQRAADFLPQIAAPRTSIDTVKCSLRLILFGYFKKMVIADSLAGIIAPVFDQPGHYNALTNYAAMCFFYIQIYADFSGVIDIANGVAKLFGIDAPPNFDRPLYASNIQVYWRKWHMTLTSWLRDYLFTPMNILLRYWGTAGLALCLMVNMVVIGVWHGFTANFLIFGVLHGIFMIVSVFTLKARNTFFAKYPALTLARRLWTPVITFHLVAVPLVFLRADSPQTALEMLSRLFCGDISVLELSGLGLGLFQGLMFAAGLLVMERVHALQAQPDPAKALAAMPTWLRWTFYNGFLLAIYLVSRGTVPQQFIYANF